MPDQDAPVPAAPGASLGLVCTGSDAGRGHKFLITPDTWDAPEAPGGHRVGNWGELPGGRIVGAVLVDDGDDARTPGDHPRRTWRETRRSRLQDASDPAPCCLAHPARDVVDAQGFQDILGHAQPHRVGASGACPQTTCTVREFLTVTG